MTKFSKLIFSIFYLFIWLNHSIAQGELIPVQLGKYWGYTDEKGNIVINPTFGKTWRFSDGLALVKTREMDIFHNDVFGFINQKGEYVITPKFSGFTSSFSDGYAIASVHKYEGDKEVYISYIIDKKGKIIFSDSSKDFKISSFLHNGLATLQGANFNGFINTDGKIIKLPNCSVGFDKVPCNKSQTFAYYIPKNSNQRTYINFDGSIKNNFQPPLKTEPTLDKQENGIGLLECLLQGEYFIFFYPPYVTFTETKTGLIRKDGKIILPAQYFEGFINVFSKDLIFYRIDSEKYIAINSDGVIVIKPKFNDINVRYDNGEK